MANVTAYGEPSSTVYGTTVSKVNGITLSTPASYDTTFNAAVDNNWSTAGNWSDGKPTSTTTAGIDASVTSLVIDEAASAAGLDLTGTSGVTISGSGALTMYGDFTLDSDCSWTNTGILSFTDNSATISTGGVSLGTVASAHVKNGCSAVLAGPLNIGSRALYIYNNSTGFDSAGYQVDCGVFGDNGAGGTFTLDLDSSTVNCANVAFTGTAFTLTQSGNINISSSGTVLCNWAGKTWSGTTTVTLANATVFIPVSSSAVTFGNLSIIFNPGASMCTFSPVHNLTITNALNLTCNVGGTGSNIRGIFKARSTSSRYYTRAGTPITVSAGSVSLTGAVDFEDISATGAASWDLSSGQSGNRGGNTGITFRTPTTYWLANADNSQDYGNVYSATYSPRTAVSSNFPLPQDTLIIDDNSFSTDGVSFWWHNSSYPACGAVDASALTRSITISLPAAVYGSLDYTGSGITLTSSAYTTLYFDARLCNENSSDLTVNVPHDFNGKDFVVASVSGSVALASDLSGVGITKLYYGELDLDGNTLETTNVDASIETTARSITDTTGGGKLLLTKTAGSVFAAGTSGLTISNSPDVTVGTSDQTLTADQTFAGGGQAYGDLFVAKHAGDYELIVTGGNTFNSTTQETVDGTYPYNGVTIS